MKKSALAVAVASTVASGAYANMYVNADGTGQYLIYPFYTADAGNETYIHVVNTTAMAKAVKVRILEAENSYEVRDFNVYLSPYDHFSFAISLDENGGGRLDTGDNSCTVPSLADGVDFTSALYDAVDADGNPKEENPSIERTLNGHVEIIEMGQFGLYDVDAGTWSNTRDDKIPALWLHGENDDGVWEPADCAAVEKLWTKGTNGAASGAWFAEGPPDSGKNGISGESTAWNGGGLYGMGIVANPDQGWALGYDAVAVENFVEDGTVGNGTDLGGGAHLHYYPGDTDPGLGSPAAAIAVDSWVFDDETLYDLSHAAPALAMASLFQAEKIQNDYVLDPIFDGSTDWVVTFPTKYFHVNGTSPVQPFTNVWNGKTACEEYTIQTWDREEKTFVPEGGQVKPPFSPYTFEDDPEDPVEICYETNILTFGTQEAGGEGVFDSTFYGTELSLSSGRIQTKIGTEYNNGWAELTWTDAGHQIAYTGTGDNADFSFLGLPAVGFAAVQFENGTLEGGSILANYASAHVHKFEKTVSVAAN